MALTDVTHRKHRQVLAVVEAVTTRSTVRRQTGAAVAGTELGILVADAHLAAAVEATSGPHTVLTSDTQDLTAVADHLCTPVRLVAV